MDLKKFFTGAVRAATRKVRETEQDIAIQATQVAAETLGTAKTAARAIDIAADAVIDQAMDTATQSVDQVQEIADSTSDTVIKGLTTNLAAEAIDILNGSTSGAAGSLVSSAKTNPKLLGAESVIRRVFDKVSNLTIVNPTGLKATGNNTISGLVDSVESAAEKAANHTIDHMNSAEPLNDTPDTGNSTISDIIDNAVSTTKRVMDSARESLDTTEPTSTSPVKPPSGPSRP